MSFRGYIGSGHVLAAFGASCGFSVGLVGLVESQYHAAGSVSAMAYGFGLYALVGIAFGLAVAILFGGKARSGREGLERMAGRVACWPVGITILAAGGFLVYRDVWQESVSGAGFVGWVTMLLIPLVALVGILIARAIGRGVASRPITYAGAGLALALAGFLLGATIEQLPTSSVNVSGRQADERPAIVFVVVDALRADATGLHGAGPEATPELDAFARDATVFQDAWAPASWTRPSVATILTGRYPSAHQAIHKSDRLPEAVPTLAGLLAKSGYVTVASVTNVNLAPVFGLGRGFDVWAYFPPEPFLGAPSSGRRLFLVEIYRLFRLRFLPGQREVARYYAEGERILERGTKLMASPAGASVPFFAYLHFMEPHDPYFAHPYDGRAVARVENPHPPVEEAPAYLDLYRQEVRQWDTLFGQLMAFLKKAGVYDRALIVVTADHGEEFADHGGFWHGTTLYQELVHVPLVVRFPHGAGAGTVRDEPVTLVDLVPTALEHAGVKSPGGLPGEALSARVAHGARMLFAEEDHQGCVITSVRDGPWKLIRANPDNPRNIPELQLFNLEADPREHRDLAEQETARRDRLLTLLEEGPGRAAASDVKPQGVTIDSETEEQLRSLGYTE